MGGGGRLRGVLSKKRPRSWTGDLLVHVCFFGGKALSDARLWAPSFVSPQLNFLLPCPSFQNVLRPTLSHLKPVPPHFVNSVRLIHPLFPVSPQTVFSSKPTPTKKAQSQNPSFCSHYIVLFPHPRPPTLLLLLHPDWLLRCSSRVTGLCGP